MAAIGDPYGSVQRYKDTKEKTSARDDVVLQRQLLFVSRLYEIEAGQFFNMDAAVVNRIFCGNGLPYLYLDREGDMCPGVATLTGVVVTVDEDEDGSFADETAWATTDYQLHPLNADKGPEAHPWNKIVIPSWSTESVFPAGMPVQVTAKFGWPAVPETVIEDVLEILAIWRGESARATGRMSELDEITTLSPMAMSLLKRSAGAYRQRALV